jgi:hypothetical protein
VEEVFEGGGGVWKLGGEMVGLGNFLLETKSFVVTADRAMTCLDGETKRRRFGEVIANFAIGFVVGEPLIEDQSLTWRKVHKNVVGSRS